MGKLIKEFKEFALRGNVIDLTLGIVLGGAFTKIINSLVSDLIMPSIGAITGSIDFSSLSWSIKQLNTGNEFIVRYGAFIDATVNFLIIAVAMFIAIKAINKLKRNKPEEPTETTEKEEVTLLREIRDSLRNQND